MSSDSSAKVKDVLAGIGLAAVGLSLVQGARVMWHSYREKRNNALEEYPPPNQPFPCHALALQLRSPVFSTLPRHQRAPP